MHTPQTKQEWLKQEKEGILLALLGISLLLAGFFGLFFFGVSCLFLTLTQAVGAGITAGLGIPVVVTPFLGRWFWNNTIAEMKSKVFKESDDE